jgi:hypothetical protein
VDIEFIGKDHHLMRLHVCVMKPHAGQACDPRVGHHLWPRAWRVSTFGLERRREGGTTPPRAAPAIGPWSCFEYGTEGTREPGHQDTRLDSHRELAIGVNPCPKAPGAIRPHDPVHAGARAKQKGRNLRGGSAARAQQ